MNKKISIFIISLLMIGAAAESLISAEKEVTPLESKKFSDSSSSEIPSRKVFRHVIRTDISTGDNILNLSIAYSVLWAYYLGFQWETIQEHGSFKNWYSNMYQPHFDHDSYNYNLIMHSLAGNYYYLFYRYRGHTKGGALLWSAVTQILFEFTVETITEPPSFQDIYQTPILGAVLGISLEYLSCKLLSTNYTAAHILGYILNPFALFPFASYESVSIPVVTTDTIGYRLTFRF